MCHFPIGILGQVWYLIVSIPDLCTPTNFVCNRKYLGVFEFKKSPVRRCILSVNTKILINIQKQNYTSIDLI